MRFNTTTQWILVSITHFIILTVFKRLVLVCVCVCVCVCVRVCVCVCACHCSPLLTSIVIPCFAILQTERTFIIRSCAFSCGHAGGKKRNLFRSVLVNDLPQKGLLSHLPSLLLTYFLKTRRRRGTDTEKGDRTGMYTYMEGKKHQDLTWHMILRLWGRLDALPSSRKLRTANGGEAGNSSGGHSCSEQCQAHAPSEPAAHEAFCCSTKTVRFSSLLLCTAPGASVP